MQPSSPHPPPSAFRVHTYVYVARAKVTVSRSFFQCHLIQEKHISCGCDDVTFLLAVSDKWSVIRVRLRHIHVKTFGSAMHYCITNWYVTVVIHNRLLILLLVLTNAMAICCNTYANHLRASVHTKYITMACIIICNQNETADCTKCIIHFV